MGGNSDYWCMESQDRNIFFTQLYLFFGWVKDKVSKQINLPGPHVCATKTMAIRKRVAYNCLIWLWYLFFVKLVEGKDAPEECPPKQYSEKWENMSLILRLTKKLHGTGEIVLLDSGFCVLQGLVDIEKKGVYGAALTKKRWYWPRYIDWKIIKAHFINKGVGAVGAHCGELDNVPLRVLATKEEDCVMMLMSTYGTNEWVGEDKFRKIGGERITFKYSETVYKHYQHRDDIDSHNTRRQAPIALEETWSTRRWENRSFAFLLALSEVNDNLGEHQFCGVEAIKPIWEFKIIISG